MKGRKLNKARGYAHQVQVVLGGKRVQVAVPDDLMDRLEAYARDNGCSMSEAGRELIARGLVDRVRV